MHGPRGGCEVPSISVPQKRFSFQPHFPENTRLPFDGTGLGAPASWRQAVHVSTTNRLAAGPSFGLRSVALTNVWDILPIFTSYRVVRMNRLQGISPLWHLTSCRGVKIPSKGKQ